MLPPPLAPPPLPPSRGSAPGRGRRTGPRRSRWASPPGSSCSALAPGGPRWLASALRLREPARPRTPASFPDGGRVRRGVPLARVHRLLPAGRARCSRGRGVLATRPGDVPRRAPWTRARAFGELPRARPSLHAPDHLSGIFPPGVRPASGAGVPRRRSDARRPACSRQHSSWPRGCWRARWRRRRESRRTQRGDRSHRRRPVDPVCGAALSHRRALPYGAAAVAVAMALAAAMRAGAPAMRASSAWRARRRVPRGDAADVGHHDGRGRRSARVGARARGRAVSVVGLRAALPGLLLLMAANHAAVGRVFASPVAAYRAAFEAHAYPSAPRRGRDGHAPPPPRAPSRRRQLRALALLALVAVSARRCGGPRLGAIVVAGQSVLAAPFDTPPASRRGPGTLLVAVIPIEHALIAVGLARLFPRRLAACRSDASPMRCLPGFAVHASNDHERLASSDIGRPRFEPDVAREANVTHGLLFFDDDQGFELAFDPGVPPATASRPCACATTTTTGSSTTRSDTRRSTGTSTTAAPRR